MAKEGCYVSGLAPAFFGAVLYRRKGGAGGLGRLVAGGLREALKSCVDVWWSERVALVLVVASVWPSGTPGSAKNQREVPEKDL